MATKDYMQLYNNGKAVREPYITKSQLIAQYTIDSLRIQNFRTSESTFPHSVKTPFSDVGPRCVKGISSIISNLLNPPNLSSFILENNVKLELQPEEQNLLDALYVGIEKSINSFKNQNGYKPYQYQGLISCCINGQIGTKVTENGYMRYDLDSFVTSRHRGQLEYAIFEECIKDEDGKDVPQYIYVDYQDNKVYLQIGDGRPELQDGEDSSQYIISTLTVPMNENYAQSIFADHYGVLKSINKSWEYLEEAQDLAGYNIQTFTGPQTISTKDLSRIPRRSVIRVPNHDVLKWQGVGNEKLNSWQWVSTLVTAREQQLLTNFGIGLLQRAGQLQTATEVRAVVNELTAITGPLVIVWADTFSSPCLRAEMKVLNTKERLDNALSAKGLEIPEKQKDKLMVPVVVSGISALARNESAEAMLSGLSNLIKNLGVTPEAQAALLGSFRLDKISKKYLDNLNIDTTDILQDYVAPQQQAAPGGEQPDQSQVNAVSSLPPELLANLPANIQGQGPDVIAQYLLNNRGN